MDNSTLSSCSKLIFLLFLGFFCELGAAAFASVAAATAAMKDHSAEAVNLFSNMRTPAGLIAGSILSLGVMGAPTIQKGDSRTMKLMKTANVLVGITSLLNEVLAVSISSIVINKLVEVPQPATAGVAELIAQKHEFAWLGTNIHFILGLMGLSLLVGARIFFIFGEHAGKVAFGCSVSTFLLILSIVNKGIAEGAGDNCRFASNFVTLILRYTSLLAKHSTEGVCSFGALMVGLLTLFQAVKVFFAIKEMESLKME